MTAAILTPPLHFPRFSHPPPLCPVSIPTPFVAPSYFLTPNSFTGFQSLFLSKWPPLALIEWHPGLPPCFHDPLPTPPLASPVNHPAPPADPPPNPASPPLMTNPPPAPDRVPCFTALLAEIASIRQYINALLVDHHRPSIISLFDSHSDIPFVDLASDSSSTEDTATSTPPSHPGHTC